VAEFWPKGGGSLAFVWLTYGEYGVVLAQFWVISGYTAKLWASFGLLTALIWLTYGKQHLGQPWPVIPCGMWAKISAEIKPDPAQGQFAIWDWCLKVDSNPGLSHQRLLQLIALRQRCHSNKKRKLKHILKLALRMFL